MYWTCSNVLYVESFCLPICGDGHLIGYETCDDGDTDPITTGCNLNCIGSQPGYTCTGGSLTTASICTTVCGDGIKTENEVCDDGNTVPGDGCDSTCQVESGWSCTSING